MARGSNPRIGLTGGIGSGKSTVARLLEQHGAWLIDTDAISRELTAAGGDAIAAIRDTFGAEYIDGSGALDRARMRSRVFQEPESKQRLERILHPMIGRATQVRSLQAAPGQWLVYDVPLLVESGRWRVQVDRVLVVDCTVETQMARVMARSGLGEPEVRAIIDAQASRAARRACADAVLHNDGCTVEQLAAEVAALWHHWTNKP